MYAIQVFDPDLERTGWHFVLVINEDEAGWCYAVVPDPDESDAKEAVEAAQLVAENTGKRTGVIQLETGVRIFDSSLQ